MSLLPCSLRAMRSPKSTSGSYRDGAASASRHATEMRRGVARAPVGDVDLLSWAFASPSGVLGTTYSFGTSSTRSAAGLTLDIGPLKKAVATRDKMLAKVAADRRRKLESRPLHRLSGFSQGTGIVQVDNALA